jgi:amino acid permease
MMLNFGMSHTINGLSKRQNLALVLYTNLLLLPTLLKIIKKELVLSPNQVAGVLGMCVCVCVCVCVYMYVYIYMHTKIIEKELVLYTEREREREKKRDREKEREGGGGERERGKTCVVWMTFT